MKICQCRRDFLSSTILEIAAKAGMFAPLRRNEYASNKAEEILKILESDCVCEKKEEKYLSLKDLEKLNVGDVVRLSSALYQMSDMVSQKFELVKEKQSQSPCEHEWSVLKSKKLEYIPCMKDMYVNEYPTGMWGCHQCGLVTCNNPNDKDV